MKRFIAAVSFAVLSTSALAENGKPFEQLEVDRRLPNVTERMVSTIEYPLGGAAPYDQLAIDRAIPEIRPEHSLVASSGGSRSDVEIATEAAEVTARSFWANDHNFIAPAK